MANPWQAKDLNDLKLVTLPPGERTRMPTGKWSKGFFYQSPRNIDAYFQFNGVADDPRNQGGDANEFSIFAYPNKLNLDDRIGMLAVSFPQRRYIDYGLDRNAAVYDLSNPLKTDTILYPISPNNYQDLRLSYVQPAEGRLPRQIERFDELTVATSWSTPAGDKSMQIIAAEGSPYVTVRYTGLRPVVQVGQGSAARTAKKINGLNIDPLTRDYTQQESESTIEAVAVGEVPLTKFTERDENRVTPVLTGTKFRFVYQLPDRAQTTPGTNDLKPVNPVLTLRELVLYASRPITLEWDTPSRSYISRDALPVVIRTAFVDDVLYDPDVDKPEIIADTPAFKARRAILDQYAATFPTSSGLFVDYAQENGFVTYRWKTERMDGQPAQDGDLLMMAFDATHTPSLQNAKLVDGIAYRSNFGMMSGVAGSEWKQKLSIPRILRLGATGDEFWMGTGTIKTPDDKDILASLKADTELLTVDFLATCNTDSYICGQYMHNVARLALIANNLNAVDTRNQLLAYLKNSMRLWLDGFDPSGKKVLDPATDKKNDVFLYDSTNGGIITSQGLQDHKKDYSNRAYVDHMFHYGYFIYAASVIAQLDTPKGEWLSANKEKVNLLVRDIANPSLADESFPIVRTFDWFRMQNIADAGPDANGGNTESSSESINANYALVAWGIMTENNAFQALAAIMTAAEIRTAQAFYQITPDTAYLKYIEHPKVSVTVKLPNGGSEERTIEPLKEPVMNIVRSNLMETNTFFGGLLINRIGINLLPITPISEFVISPAWARAHATTLRTLETTQTQQFTDIVNAVPSESSPCFVAAWSPPGPHLDEKTGKFIDPPPPGNACAGKLRVLYSWCQLAVAGVGITDPTNAYQRYVGYMNDLENQQKIYKQNTRSDIHPGSSELREGINADVLKDNSTPSTNTNTLWWLSSRKPG